MDFGIREFEERLPDTDALRARVEAIKNVGERTYELTDSIRAVWLRLTGHDVYTAPGNEKVFTALDASRTSAETLSNRSVLLSTVMRSYADTVDELKVRLESLRARVAAFNRNYPQSEQDEWDNNSEAITARNTLASDVGRLHADLDEAQRDAATWISHLTDSDRTYAKDSENLNAGTTGYGYGYEDYAAAFSGGYLSKDLPWYVDMVNFIGDTAAGVPAAGWEMVEGIGVLIGFQGWNKAGAAWKSMYRTAENVYVLMGPGVPSARDSQAAMELVALGPVLIRYDQWQSDRPGLALGGNIFDVGTLFLGGAGAAGGAAKTGAKAATFAERLGAGAKSPGDGPGGFGGLTPALPGGQVPVSPRTFEIPDNSTMLREGKGSAGGKPFADTYSPLGRGPADQPRVGDADGGNGSWQDVSPRSINGAPEQQYITGVDRVHDTQAREYLLPDSDGNMVAFDNHHWRGDPPREYFTEVKGNYEWMKPEWLRREFRHWVTNEFARQAKALEHAGTTGYVHEIVFTQKSVMDQFDAYLPRTHPLRKHMVLRFEPMP
ncbi:MULTISPECIES: hypothetical protein [unclassified Arthrobacter]|uniref:hypothetical protein n=1 Tax=unclassified Arthrobacter TaxID=235627 RepID=UPI0006DA7764|nr:MULTISPECIES: hypothetical protein [unclassified Arthrobacter]KPN21722.1 hypothetical protein AO716_01490 [Arthrobacter sp. Edens01]MSR99601.1 hypothetical protein [Arthrobacter sp. BL-252-APC-1A]